MESYKKELIERELTENTIKMYLKTVEDFLDFAGDDITQSKLIEYKKVLLKKYAISTTNTKIVVLNNFLDFKNKDIKIKQEKVQKSNTVDNVLSETDFNRLIRMASTKDKERARITMLIFYYTGLRVSELEFLTVESINKGYIDINNKGKHRRAPIIKSLSKELKKFIADENIKSGPIIVNRSGDPLSRSYIFKELKWIGGQARVRKDKVYPHSFRHLFAKQWLKVNNNNFLALADILGHSSLETTRIYSTLSTDEQRDTIKF